MATSFIDCTSLSISYDVMGIATVNYVIVSDDPTMQAYSTLTIGGRTFDGYVSNINMNMIPFTDWYENHVTLIATSN